MCTLHPVSPKGNILQTIVQITTGILTLMQFIYFIQISPVLLTFICVCVFLCAFCHVQVCVSTMVVSIQNSSDTTRIPCVPFLATLSYLTKGGGWLFSLSIIFKGFSQPCYVYHWLIPFYCWVIFHVMAIPLFV